MGELWHDLLVQFLLFVCLALLAGAAAVFMHGWLLHSQLRCAQRLADCHCITGSTRALAGVSLATFLVLVFTVAPAVPWDWLGTAAVLTVTAPWLLTWLGPPDEHVEACHVCQIGKGSAYSHYFGYLRLMQGENGTRKRLEDFKRGNVPGLPSDKRSEFYSDAVIVLAPDDGEYPSAFDWSHLRGIGEKVGEVRDFQCTLGGNKRSYGAFDVHEVTSSDNDEQQRRYVALDKVDALKTLQKLRQHGPGQAGVSDADRLKQMRKQMLDMMDELEKIIEDNGELRGQLKVVRYNRREHVGDVILTAIGEGNN